MKKIILFFLIMPFLAQAEIANINSTDISYTVPLVTWSSCDETKVFTLYTWNYFALLDSFQNRTSTPVYIQWAVFSTLVNTWTDNNWLCLFNKTLYKDWDYRLLAFNKPYLSSQWWKVSSWQKVRHLTTNQEYWSWWEFWIWNMNSPYMNSDLPWNLAFNQANIRNPLNHPIIPTVGNNFDCQVKVGTIYDTDDNIATSTDNKMIVECANFQIRWCWDGILSWANWETCDHWASNWTPWNTCSSTCQIVPPIPGSWLGTTTSHAWEWNVPTDTTNNPNF